MIGHWGQVCRLVEGELGRRGWFGRGFGRRFVKVWRVSGLMDRWSRPLLWEDGRAGPGLVVEVVD